MSLRFLAFRLMEVRHIVAKFNVQGMEMEVSWIQNDLGIERKSTNGSVVVLNEKILWR